MFTFTAFDALQGAEVEVALTGIYDLPATGPINAGAAVYWDGSKVTGIGSPGTLVGAALVGVGGGRNLLRRGFRF